MLLVDQRLQHLSHHAEMVPLPLELALQVDEIGGRGVEALGQQTAQVERDFGMRLEEALGILEDDIPGPATLP